MGDGSNEYRITSTQWLRMTMAAYLLPAIIFVKSQHQIGMITASYLCILDISVTDSVHWMEVGQQTMPLWVWVLIFGKWILCNSCWIWYLWMLSAMINCDSMETVHYDTMIQYGINKELRLDSERDSVGQAMECFSVFMKKHDFYVRPVRHYTMMASSKRQGV